MIRKTLLSLFVIFTSQIIDAEISIYNKSFILRSNIPENISLNKNSFSSYTNRTRTFFSHELNDDYSLILAYDISFLGHFHKKNTSDSVFFPYSRSFYRFDDLKTEIHASSEGPEQETKIYQNLDRFFLKIKKSNYDLFIGRQSIAWGNAKAINPTDIFIPFEPHAYDKDERMGVDALRVRIPVNLFSEIDCGYVAGRHAKKDENSFFIRGKFYISQTDISLLSISFKNNVLWGMDISKNIGNAGMYWENAYVNLARNYEHYKNYFRSSVGLDYNFYHTYFFIEYHFNGAGISHVSRDDLQLNHPAYKEGGTYLLNKHYVIVGVNYNLTSLIQFQNEVFFNLNDNSLLLIPKLEYNCFTDIYLSLGAFLGVGKNKTYETEIRSRSEFYSYGNTIHLSLKKYF